MATQTASLEGVPPAIPERLRRRFELLADRWNEETEFVSSSTMMVLNSAYQQIIGMGEAVLPLILERLETQGGHWFWALQHISGEDPIPTQDVGNYSKMREAWLRWGLERHYL
jgi:hypothetical protein